MKDPFLTKDGSSGTMIRTKASHPVVGYQSAQFIQLAEDLINRHNEDHKEDFSGVAVFPNYQSAFLFLEEFLGQISDGKYENSNIDWKWYGRLLVKVDALTGPALMQGHNPNRPLRFTDLLWLFDGDDYSKNPQDCRAIFSHCPTKELHRFAQEAARSINPRKEVFA